jgi:hypothetical protein
MIHIYRLTLLGHGATPCYFPLPIPLANSPWQLPFPWVPPTCWESLLFAWCDHRPPWSQVACKLTSPSPFPPHSLFPHQRFPNSIMRPSTTTSWHRLHLVRHKTDLRLLLIIRRVTVKWETNKACFLQIKTWKSHQKAIKYAPAILSSFDLSFTIHSSQSQSHDTIPLNAFVRRYVCNE